MSGAYFVVGDEFFLLVSWQEEDLGGGGEFSVFGSVCLFVRFLLLGSIGYIWIMVLRVAGPSIAHDY